MVAWILKGSRKNDFMGMHIVHWLSIPPYVVIAVLLNLSVGCVLTFQISCDPLLNFHYSELILKTQTKAIHYCQNAMPMRYFDHLLTILALAFAFCNKTD